MLEPAILNAQSLRDLFARRILQPDAKYYYFQSFHDFELLIESNDWKRIQYVAKSSNGTISAYFEARVNRESQVVEDLFIISLGRNTLAVEATYDVFRFIYYLLKVRNFRKIFFRFVKDNPAADQYRRLFCDLARCGSIQGVLKDYVTLADLKTYDLVVMDILRDPYISWYEKKNAAHSST